MPLQGLKVIEHATYIAAPGAGGLMADWGAEVVKIEPPGGDPIRRFFDTIGADMGVNPVFDLDNRGKRSIMVDTATAEGRAIVHRLVKDADVFLTNVRPGGLARGGLDHETLRAINPRLIYASVTGYGLTGPDADRPGFDMAAFWARSGWGHLTAPKGVDPFPLRTAVGDHICSLATLAGVLAAVHERSRTGRGRLVEASLLRAGTYTLGSDMAIQMRFGRVASTRPREAAINPIANFFRCKDDRWLALLPRQGSKDWGVMCEALGLAGLRDDPRFATAKARRENGAAVVEALDAAFAALPFEEAAARLDAHDLVWAPFQSAAEAARDPQLLAAGGVVTVPDGQGGVFQAPAGPIRFPGLEQAPGPAPTPGQHTREVLLQAGYAADEIEALMASGAARDAA
jgi:crotonobetainyl-CoA:carnitine CoA-transferase CaiB-like acyl-CoA transferase